MSDIVARLVRVHGDVQGVFFRDSTRTEASRRGVAGWVRNCSDGTVEALFEGDPGEVDALVRWCQSGPPRATVDRVDEQAADPDGLTTFEVR
jgi:acylphosphatase